MLYIGEKRIRRLCMKKQMTALIVAALLLLAGAGIIKPQAAERQGGRLEIWQEQAETGETAAFRAARTGVSSIRAKWDSYATEYYYNKLEGAERTLYENLDELCYEYLVTGADADASGQMLGISYEGLDARTRAKVYYLFRYSNPQYYFLTSKFIYDAQGLLYPVLYPAFADGQQRQSETERFQATVDAVIAEISESEDKLVREQRIHDWITDTAVYDAEYERLAGVGNNALWEYELSNGYTQSCYSVFCKEGAATVCAGYAESFVLLCNALGIEAISVSSPSHQWNQVRMEGSWYQVDCTWDDSDDNSHSYYYFNRSTEQLAQMDGGSSHILESYYDGLVDASDCLLDSGADGVSPGQIHTAEETAAMPAAELSVSGGQLIVTLSGASEDTGIYYTTDEEIPSVSESRCSYYRRPFAVERDTVIKAVAVKNGCLDSSVYELAATDWFVVFDRQDGTTQLTMAPRGQKIEEPEEPVRTGYRFGGWYRDASCVTKWEFASDIPSGDMTLYAQWIPQTYLLEFHANGGSCGQAEKEITYGASYGALPVPVREGYTFLGWYTQSVGGEVISADAVLRKAGNVIAYAHWKQDAPKAEPLCVVTFEQCNGEAAIVLSVKQGETLYKPQEPRRAGYRFSGWYQDASCTRAWNFKSGVQGSSLKLYAGWIPMTYRIIYYMDKGTNHKLNPLSFQLGNRKYTLYQPTKKGYLFEGWYADSDYRQKITTLSADKADNLKVYAKWKKLTVGRAQLRRLSGRSRGRLTVTIKRMNGAAGYELRYSTRRNMKSAAEKTTRSIKKTIKGLKAGRRYYIQVRAYGVDSAGKVKYGRWSRMRSVRLPK